MRVIVQVDRKLLAQLPLDTVALDMIKLEGRTTHQSLKGIYSFTYSLTPLLAFHTTLAAQVREEIRSGRLRPTATSCHVLWNEDECDATKTDKALSIMLMEKPELTNDQRVKQWLQYLWVLGDIGEPARGASLPNFATHDEYLEWLNEAITAAKGPPPQTEGYGWRQGNSKDFKHVTIWDILEMNYPLAILSGEQEGSIIASWGKGTETLLKQWRTDLNNMTGNDWYYGGGTVLYSRQKTPLQSILKTCGLLPVNALTMQ